MEIQVQLIIRAIARPILQITATIIDQILLTILDLARVHPVIITLHRHKPMVRLNQGTTDHQLKKTKSLRQPTSETMTEVIGQAQVADMMRFHTITNHHYLMMMAILSQIADSRATMAITQMLKGTKLQTVNQLLRKVKSSTWPNSQISVEHMVHQPNVIIVVQVLKLTKTAQNNLSASRKMKSRAVVAAETGEWTAWNATLQRDVLCARKVHGY